MSGQKKSFVDPSCSINIINAASGINTSNWNTNIQDITNVLELNTYAQQNEE